MLFLSPLKTTVFIMEAVRMRQMKKTVLYVLLALSMMTGPAFAEPSIKVSGSEVTVKESVTDGYVSQMKSAQRLVLVDISDADLAKACSACPDIAKIEIKSKNLTSIAPVAGLTKLQNFKMEADKVKDLSPLEKLTGLQYLYVISSAMGPDLKWMAGMTALKDVSISAGPSLTSFEGLPKVAGLSRIKISSASPADLSPLQAMPGLKDVDLTGCVIADLSPLAKLPALQYVNLYGATVKDFSPLAACPKLKKIMYYSTKDADYSTLGKLTQVTELKGGLTKLDSIAWVASLPNLKIFDVFAEYVTDYSPLAKTNVEEFQIWNMRVPVGDLGVVGQAKSLKKLKLWSVEGATNSKGLSGLVNLEKFTLTGSYNKKGGEAFDFAAASGWTKLQELEANEAALQNTDTLSKCTALKTVKFSKLNGDPVSLAFLGKLTSLTKLELNQSKVKDFDAVAGCTALTTVVLTKVEGITSLAALKKLPALKTVVVSKGAFPDSELAGFAAGVRVTQR